MLLNLFFVRIYEWVNRRHKKTATQINEGGFFCGCVLLLGGRLLGRGLLPGQRYINAVEQKGAFF